ncbi:hypothetical protein SLA2020_114720 [Shorea laevis]
MNNKTHKSSCPSDSMYPKHNPQPNLLLQQSENRYDQRHPNGDTRNRQRGSSTGERTRSRSRRLADLSRGGSEKRHHQSRNKSPHEADLCHFWKLNGRMEDGPTTGERISSLL